MSQVSVFNISSSGDLPGNVPTSFVTDSGTAIPAAQILNVNGAGLPNPAVIDDNDNGIETYANPDLSNNLAIFLTNRKVGTGQTVGAVTDDLFTQNLGGTPGVYNFQCYASAFESTTPAGAGFTVFGAVRTDGASATIIVTDDVITDAEAALPDVDVDIVTSGNDIIFRATGQAGLTIDWKVLAQYIFIG